MKRAGLFSMRKKRTDTELKKASGHLYYEIEMFIGCAQELAKGAHNNRTVANALLESFTIHARAILDFLYASESAREDDVIAEDFFDEPCVWHSVRPEKTTLLDSIHKRVGKEIAHLTYTRQEVTPEAKKWHYLRIYHDVAKVLQPFLEKVPQSKLDPSLLELGLTTTQ